MPSKRSGGLVVGWFLDERLLGQEAFDVAADRDPELDRLGTRHLLHAVAEVVVQDQSRVRVIDDAGSRPL